MTVSKLNSLGSTSQMHIRNTGHKLGNSSTRERPNNEKNTEVRTQKI